jgi:long-subunit fatty acid transport protein
VTRTRQRLVAVTFACALAAGPALASNGARLTSVGVRAAGRAGVDYAFADDATAPATNPAGIAFTPNRLDQTWLAALPESTFRNQFGIFHESPGWTVPFPAYSFGVIFDPTQSWHVGDLFDLGNWGLKPSAQDPPGDETDKPLPPAPKPTIPVDAKPTSPSGEPVPGAEPSDEELYGGRFRFGFGVYPVSGGQFLYRHIVTPFWAPNSVTYSTSATLLSLAPSAAFRIIGNGDFSLSLGYSPQFLYGTFQLKGPIQQPNTTLSSDFRLSSIFAGSNNLTTYSISHDLTTFGFSQRVGLMFVMKMFSLGLVYQDRSYLQDYLGEADVDSTNQINQLTQGTPSLLQVVDPRINPALGFRSRYGMRVQNFQQPRGYGVGIAFRPLPRVALGLDYTFINWEELYRDFQARLTAGSNPNLDILTSQTLKVRVPLEYKNQHVVAVGASVVVLQGEDIVPDVPSFQVILRAGYNWGQNPVPANTAIPQTPIFYEHHISGGLTFQWGPYLDFSIAAEYAFYNSIHTGNSVANSDLSSSHQEVSLFTLQLGFGVNF